MLALALICCGILSLAVSAVVLVKRSQSSTLLLTELHHCATEMCLFSIMPGTTSIADARSDLRNTGAFTVADFSQDTAFKQSAPFYRIDLEGQLGACNTSAPDCVAQLDLVFPLDHDSLSSGQIIAQFGAPCGIIPDFIPRRTVLFYPGMVLFFMSDVPSTGQRFQPILLLGQINVFKNGESCEQIAAQTSDYNPWRGFTIYPKNTVK